MKIHVTVSVPVILSSKLFWELYVFVASGAMSNGDDQGPESEAEEKTLLGLASKTASCKVIFFDHTRQSVLWIVGSLVGRNQVVYTWYNCRNRLKFIA